MYSSDRKYNWQNNCASICLFAYMTINRELLHVKMLLNYEIYLSFLGKYFKKTFFF